MLDLLKGLTSGGWGGFFAWIAPIAVVLVGFWCFVYLQLDDPPLDSLLGGLSTSDACVALLITATAFGTIASACSTPLYRVLEGYLLWPKWLADWRADRHRVLQSRLDEKIKVAANGWKRNLDQEKFLRYPLEPIQVVPTRFGNAIRAFETYGKTRFGLDSGTLWSELIAVIPEALQKDIDTSRAIVDFFVCGFYSALSCAVAAIVLGIMDDTYAYPLTFAAVALLASALCYEMAVSSCTYWGATNRALINVGREPLAKSLGLSLPAKLEDEFDMWQNVVAYVYYNKPLYGDAFDPYRRIE
jgi:hypothetical protein